MNKLTGSITILATFAALAWVQPSTAATIGISPRLALPTGDFGDVVSTGFGLSVTIDKSEAIRGGLSFLNFGEGDFGSGTAIGAFVGYRRDIGPVYGKFDASLMRIKQEAELFGFTTEASETKLKLTPGIGYRMGKMAAEVDVDIAGDWLGVNLYYMIGGE